MSPLVFSAVILLGIVGVFILCYYASGLAIRFRSWLGQRKLWKPHWKAARMPTTPTVEDYLKVRQGIESEYQKRISKYVPPGCGVGEEGGGVHVVPPVDENKKETPVEERWKILGDDELPYIPIRPKPKGETKAAYGGSPVRFPHWSFGMEAACHPDPNAPSAPAVKPEATSPGNAGGSGEGKKTNHHVRNECLSKAKSLAFRSLPHSDSLKEDWNGYRSGDIFYCVTCSGWTIAHMIVRDHDVVWCKFEPDLTRVEDVALCMRRFAEQHHHLHSSTTISIWSMAGAECPIAAQSKLSLKGIRVIYQSRECDWLRYRIEVIGEEDKDWREVGTVWCNMKTLEYQFRPFRANHVPHNTAIRSAISNFAKYCLKWERWPAMARFKSEPPFVFTDASIATVCRWTSKQLKEEEHKPNNEQQPPPSPKALSRIRFNYGCRSGDWLRYDIRVLEEGQPEASEHAWKEAGIARFNVKTLERQFHPSHESYTYTQRNDELNHMVYFFVKHCLHWKRWPWGANFNGGHAFTCSKVSAATAADWSKESREKLMQDQHDDYYPKLRGLLQTTSIRLQGNTSEHTAIRFQFDKVLDHWPGDRPQWLQYRITTYDPTKGPEYVGWMVVNADNLTYCFHDLRDEAEVANIGRLSVAAALFLDEYRASHKWPEYMRYGFNREGKQVNSTQGPYIPEPADPIQRVNLVFIGSTDVSLRYGVTVVRSSSKCKSYGTVRFEKDGNRFNHASLMPRLAELAISAFNQHSKQAGEWKKWAYYEPAGNGKVQLKSESSESSESPEPYRRETLAALDQDNTELVFTRVANTTIREGEVRFKIEAVTAKTRHQIGFVHYDSERRIRVYHEIEPYFAGHVPSILQTADELATKWSRPVVGATYRMPFRKEEPTTIA